MVFRPDPELAGLYLFGTTRIPWINHLGKLTTALVLVGIILHAGLRIVLARARRRRAERDRERAEQQACAARLRTQEVQA